MRDAEPTQTFVLKKFGLSIPDTKDVATYKGPFIRRHQQELELPTSNFESKALQEVLSSSERQ